MTLKLIPKSNLIQILKLSGISVCHTTFNKGYKSFPCSVNKEEKNNLYK